jgi:hypothetical protein
MNMATPGKLRDVVAEAFGLSVQLQMVDVHLRNLREAGLIAKAKRGRGAAEVGPDDAANLIIALAGSAYVKDSVTAVEKFGSLTPDPASFTILGERNLERRFYGYPGLELRRAHSFADAVQETLRLLCSDRFFPEPHWTSQKKERQYISMRFYLPYAAASIHFGFERQYHFNQTYGSLPLPEPRSAWDLRAIRCKGRLLNLRVVDLDALSKIAEIFREKNELP